MQFCIIFYSRITFLQGYSTVLDSAYYSTIRITILILQCSCEQIYFQAFLFQKCIAEILHSTFNLHPVSTCSAPCVETTFYLENYNSSIDCSQTTFSLHTPRLQTVYMHPDYLQSTPLESTTQPTHKNLSSWRYCIFYKKKPEQHSAQTRTRILPEEVLMLQASNGTVRVLNYRHSSIAATLQHSSLYIQRKGDVVISTISMNNLPIGHVSSTSIQVYV